jgi:hypothetical protein
LADKAGVYTPRSSDVLGSHAVRIVGWGVDEASGHKYWRVANSWNTFWGEGGFFRLRRGINACGILNTVVASSDTAVWRKRTAKAAAVED